jgi:glycosyltransferase involved in cell wall biosynthesis
VNPSLSVLVTPRDSVPYQELLYREVEAAGVRVRYDDGPTPSQTVNVALAPVLLAWYRLHGYRILHIHWVFQFSLPWARHAWWARRLMEWWFYAYLWAARVLGFQIIWTAHDLMPHDQVFANDVRARERLLSRSKVVIALSEATAKELHEMGARRVNVIPIGPFDSPYPVTLTSQEARKSLGFTAQDVVVALIGRVEEYKGADVLLRAAAKLPDSSRIKILLVGACSDESYRAKLLALADDLGTRVTAVLEWVPESDLSRYLQATDIAVFPFREITNSASVMLAQSFGLPVIITDLPSMSDLPAEAVIRFDFGVETLVDALRKAENLSESQCREMSIAALAWSQQCTWADIGAATIAAYESASGTHGG